jgi:hypothetical protein
LRSNYHELHGAEFVQEIAHLRANGGPGDAAVQLHCVDGKAVEGDPETIFQKSSCQLLKISLPLHPFCSHVPEHAHGLVEGTVAVVGGVAVLLQEILLDDFGHFQGHPLLLAQCRLAHQADRVVQFLRPLEDFLTFPSKWNKFRVIFLIEFGIQGADVFAGMWNLSGFCDST